MEENQVIEKADDADASKKIERWNAWGVASVSGKAITVILSMSVGGRHVNRTVKHMVERNLGFSGSALLAVDIRPDGYTLDGHEIGKTVVASHPQVKAVIDQVVDFIRVSAGIH